MRQRRPARVANAIPQRPFGQVPRSYEPIRVISDDHVEAIHRAALRLLAEQGIRVLVLSDKCEPVSVSLGPAGYQGARRMRHSASAAARDCL